MKRTLLLLSGLLLSAFVSGPAFAEQVRVRLTARVSEVIDSGSTLAGKVIVGQRVNGLYVYNTNTPNKAQNPASFGDYRPYANEARVRFAIGSLVFESMQPTQGIEIYVNPQTFGQGQFTIVSTENKPLANGPQVQQIFMVISGHGNLTPTVALPKVAPDFQNYWTREVTITGASSGGQYTIRAQLEASELLTPDAITVSPASGTFAPNQRFDAAMILPRNSVVATARATVNGIELWPLSYPGPCLLQPQAGSTGKPSLWCPSAESVMTIMPGAPIVWNVELTDGTVYTETVTWERAP
ncbi:MAG: hypothetical protein ABW171_11455 [Steroidobacter sp.]